MIAENMEMKERNEKIEKEKKIKCVIWNKEKEQLEIVDFPPIGRLYVTNTIEFSEFSFSKSFINDLEEIMKKHSLEELLKSGLISVYIDKDDELVYRNDKYIHIETKELNENDIVIKFSLRKTHIEEDIVSTPASYWLTVGEAFVWKGDKPSAPTHSTPTPRPERRGNRQVRVR